MMIVVSCKAQETDTSKKILNHYAGIQANQLIRQALNLNYNSTLLNNPYLLTYSLFSAKYKWGVETGFGYNYQRIKDKITATAEESKITSVSYRFGIARKINMGKRWEASAGIDYIGSYVLDKTFAFTVTNFNFVAKDSTASISTTITKTKGEGVQLRLGYSLNKYIMLSTEATFYFSISNKKSNTLVSDYITSTSNPDLDSHTISSSNTETEESDFTITVPVAIFLTIKF